MTTTMQRFPKESLTAFLNFLQAKYNAYTGAVRVNSTPYYAMIDPTDICQLRCPTCPTGIENEGRRTRSDADTIYRTNRSRLTSELFEALIRESGETLFRIDFHCWGEPLLNQDTPSYIRKAKNYDIETSIHTNLSLKLSDEQLEELLSSGLNFMIVSVDGFSQQAYEQFRIGGDVELVKDNMIRAARMRDRLELDTSIVYKYMVFSWNEHEVNEAKQFAEEHGLVFVQFDAMVPDATWLPSHRKDEEPVLSLVDIEELDRQWEQAGQPGYWREHEKHPFYLPVQVDRNWIPTRGPAPDTFCDWHYSTAVIHPGGQVAPCCMVEKEADRFGTVVPGEVSLSDVWNNENYRKSRAVFAGEAPPELHDTDTTCTRCYFPDAMKHNFSNYDSRVIAQYLHLYGDSQPVLAQAFRLLLEGEDEYSRSKYVAFFEQGVVDLLTAAKAGELVIERTNTNDFEVPNLIAPELDLEEAATIMQDYMSELSRIGVDGSTVRDTSLLPHSKNKIATALVTLARSTGNPGEKATFRNGAMVLTFFQPDVGADAIGLDETGPLAKTWRDVVESEMRVIGQALAGLG